MTQYYPLRRIPHGVPRSELWKRVRPLTLPILRSVGWSALARITPPASYMHAVVQDKARRVGDAAVEKAQSIYFQTPGLDTLTVRALARAGKLAVEAAQLSMETRIALGLDRDGRAAEQLATLPRTGYDSLMVSGLAAGIALGYFRGGAVRSLIWWDSADPDPSVRRKLPPGHPYPGVRRFQAPASLGDMASDIDDLYWADAYGQAIKVTRVGQGEERRWLVSLPGTDHGGFESEPNAADIESNLREELNMPSAMRVGTIETIRNAMAADGIAPVDMVHERVLICGHSQGGMVAVGLAAADPGEVGFTVDAVITMGSPTRRLRLRPDVQMLAIEHDQDIVPSLDATPRREADQRVVVKRKLNRPKKGPLFYAHSSSTYTGTLRATELRQAVAPWGRAGDVVTALREYLPRPGEQTRVTHHYTWQELTSPERRNAWEEYLRIKPPAQWSPVLYGGDIEVPEPKIPEPRVPALLMRMAAGSAEEGVAVSEAAGTGAEGETAVSEATGTGDPGTQGEPVIEGESDE